MVICMYIAVTILFWILAMLKVIRNYFCYISFNSIHGFVTDLRFMRLLDIAENILHLQHLVGLPDKILWRKSHWEMLGAGMGKGT